MQNLNNAAKHDKNQNDICTRRAGKLYKARSRLYRSQLLLVNTKYSLDSSRRDLHNALLCTVLESEVEKSLENHPVDPKRGEERTLLAQNKP